MSGLCGPNIGPQSAPSAPPHRPGVAVWEWKKTGRWRPYSPEVSQALERTMQKGLSQMLLHDADPMLAPYQVNLQAMQQTGGGHVYEVRRKVHKADSPAAKGAKWEWAGEQAGVWYEYMMAVQCVIEHEWEQGNQEVDLSMSFQDYPYKICIESLTQVNKYTGFVRNIRRLSQQARYPTVKEEPEETVPMPVVPGLVVGPGAKPKEKSKELKGKQKGVKKTTSSGSPAKTILNNLVNRVRGKSGSDDTPDPAPLARKGRRGSSETVSTYISQDSDSKDNLMDLDEPSTSSSSSTRCTRSHPNGLHSMGTSPPGASASSFMGGGVGGKRKRDPPTSLSIPLPPLVQRFCSPAQDVPLPNQTCPICMCDFEPGSGPDGQPYAMKGCGHINHLACLISMVQHSSKEGKASHLQCPSCMMIYGEKTGNQPVGTMTDTIIRLSLPGYPGCSTIQITYTFHSGVQGPDHPHPGKRYSAYAFPRTAYLPDNEKGRKVLRLLKVAFQRKLTFTIGQSVTTGIDDVITWNEIHHKTSVELSSAHGYPDPNYLDNVLAELATHGVTD